MAAAVAGLVCALTSWCRGTPSVRIRVRALTEGGAARGHLEHRAAVGPDVGLLRVLLELDHLRVYCIVFSQDDTT